MLSLIVVSLDTMRLKIQQEEIIARDNRMTTIPQKLANLVAISSLDVRNNRLSSIPLNLCRVVRYGGDTVIFKMHLIFLSSFFLLLRVCFFP